MTDKQNFEKDINVPSKRPDWRITLQSDHIKRLEEELKAKEQECERTKERLESFQKDYSKLYQVVENKGYIKELDQLKETNDGLLKVQYKLADSNKKLRQTIEKIKEIAENVIKNVSDRCIETTPMYGVHKQILQICDEVLSE